MKTAKAQIIPSPPGSPTTAFSWLHKLSHTSLLNFATNSKLTVSIKLKCLVGPRAKHKLQHKRHDETLLRRALSRLRQCPHFHLETSFRSINSNETSSPLETCGPPVVMKNKDGTYFQNKRFEIKWFFTRVMLASKRFVITEGKPCAFLCLVLRR